MLTSFHKEEKKEEVSLKFNIVIGEINYPSRSTHN